jgi:hypothetical protein
MTRRTDKNVKSRFLFDTKRTPVIKFDKNNKGDIQLSNHPEGTSNDPNKIAI